MSVERCEWCGGDAIPESTCPRSIACPHCAAAPGSPCRRPSGHEADRLHAGRIRQAEAVDAAGGLPAPELRLELVNATLDAWVAVRVAAHQTRQAGALSVPLYLRCLAAVRRVEDLLEPLRASRGLGWRAFEFVTVDEQLELRV